MASAAAYESSAGAGGKFRKKPLRRGQTTPYDRPPTALRPAQAAEVKNGWLSKLVDPASKLITAGAHKLFSSVFRKRLLPPPPPPGLCHIHPDEVTGIRVMKSHNSTAEVPSTTKEPIIVEVDDPSKISDSNGIAELEYLLKKKTFTRSEIDHLTSLLLSRTTDKLADADGEKIAEQKSSVPQVIHGRNEDLAGLLTHENAMENAVPGDSSTPSMRSKVLEENVASPAELAKAYMGSRPRKVSPTAMVLQNQISKEDVSAANNHPYKVRSPVTSLLQKPVSDVGTSENGFLTPRYRGKSAIYCMARTPYSRIHPSATSKASESTVGAYGRSNILFNTAENEQFSGSRKQVLKRRSSVLENDIGSVGPIRRIRQKPNLLRPKILTLPSSVGSRASYVSGMLSDASEVPSSNWNSHSPSLSKSMVDKSIPGTSSGYVPSQSIETAQKIFQHLDKFTPKGKSPDLKINVGGASSPSKMPHAPGSPTHRSMDTAGASKVSESDRDVKNDSGPSNSAVQSGAPPKISPTMEKSSLNIVEVPNDSMTSENGVEARMSNASDNNKVTDGASQSDFGHPPKKRAFQMSAHEDFLEADEDVHLNGVVSTLSNEGEEKTVIPKKSVGILDIPSQNEKPSVPVLNFQENSILSRKETKSLSDGPLTVGNASSFTFPVVPASSPATSVAVQAASNTPPSTLVSDNVQQNESKIVFPAVGSSDKLPQQTISNLSSVLDSAIENDTKLELPNCANNSEPNAKGLAEIHEKNTQETLEVHKSEDAPHVNNTGFPGNNTVDNGLRSTSSVTSLFKFSSRLSNQSSSPATFSVSSPPPLFSGGSSLSNGFGLSTITSPTAAGTVGTTGTLSSMTNLSASSSQLSSSLTASSVPPVPIQFGTSVVSSTSAASSSLISAVSTGAISSQTAIGNTVSSSTFITSSPVTSTGANGIFGFNASTSNTASGVAQTNAASAVAQTTAPTPAASSVSVFGFQASASAAPVSISTPTMNFSNPFSAPATSSNFGFSGATSVSSGASGFAANVFSSGSASASSLSLGASNLSGSSSSRTSSSLFGSSWQPSKPSFPTFGTTPPSTGFAFAASAPGASGDGSKAAVVFGSSNSGSSTAGDSSPYVFGAAAKLSAASGTSGDGNKAPVVFGSSDSGTSGNSSTFVFGAAANSTTAPVFSFGANSGTSVSTPVSSVSAFGNNATNTPTLTFGSTPPGNNDQMTMEDTMAEDSVQVSNPATSVFGQPPAPSSGSFAFEQMPSPSFVGAAPPSTGSLFQFAGQKSQMAAPSPSPFQPSGSVEFNASGGAGSFSLGTSDKSNRKIFKPKKGVRRK